MSDCCDGGPNAPTGALPFDPARAAPAGAAARPVDRPAKTPGCCAPAAPPAAPACCGPAEANAGAPGEGASACAPRPRADLLLWSTLSLVLAGVLGSLVLPHEGAGLAGAVGAYAHACAGLVAQAWWGIALGIVFAGVLGRVPQEIVVGVLGRGGGWRGLFRATACGVLMDLCNHGILMVAMRLYQRGASLGQTIAFLVASPWNSLSLTLVLAALVGFGWTIAFVLLSAVVALAAGAACEWLVRRGRLPANPAAIELPEDFRLGSAVAGAWRGADLSARNLAAVLREGVRGSRMVLRWLFLGIVIAAAVRSLVPLELYRDLFGPTFAGLMATLLAATVIEVCSEGSTPIAADLLTRASAPGNAFAFLMGGAATDYTEIMSLRDTTGSWRIAAALPLLTLPQVVLLGWALNAAA